MIVLNYGDVLPPYKQLFFYFNTLIYSTFIIICYYCCKAHIDPRLSAMMTVNDNEESKSTKDVLIRILLRILFQVNMCLLSRWPQLDTIVITS